MYYFLQVRPDSWTLSTSTVSSTGLTGSLHHNEENRINLVYKVSFPHIISMLFFSVTVLKVFPFFTSITFNNMARLGNSRLILIWINVKITLLLLQSNMHPQCMSVTHFNLIVCYAVIFFFSIFPHPEWNEFLTTPLIPSPNRVCVTMMQNVSTVTALVFWLYLVIVV